MADKSVVIFGTGHDGYEAFFFFGKENIYGYLDNSKEKIGTLFHGYEVMDSSHAMELSQYHEIIIAVSKTKWAMFAIVSQLEKLGVTNYSIYSDIRRRWVDGYTFIHRNKAMFPYEQEAALEIYRAQFYYLRRHINAKNLLPATGNLRERQLKIIRLFDLFFKEHAELSLHPILTNGSLIGAVRHGGFIPWDDDMDIMLTCDEYNRFFENCTKMHDVYYHIKGDEWKNDRGEEVAGETGFAIALGFGYLQIFYARKGKRILEELSVTDIFPLYSFPDDYTRDDYNRDLQRWVNKRFENVEKVDEEYKDELSKMVLPPKLSMKVGFGHNLTSFLAYLYAQNGRRFSCFWDSEQLFPLQKICFENLELYAPANIDQWLRTLFVGDPMSLPSRVGVYVHDKDRIFREEY